LEAGELVGPADEDRARDAGIHVRIIGIGDQEFDHRHTVPSPRRAGICDVR
jgi:hypothetical protein